MLLQHIIYNTCPLYTHVTPFFVMHWPKLIFIYILKHSKKNVIFLLLLLFIYFYYFFGGGGFWSMFSYRHSVDIVREQGGSDAVTGLPWI